MFYLCYSDCLELDLVFALLALRCSEALNARGTGGGSLFLLQSTFFLLRGGAGRGSATLELPWRGRGKDPLCLERLSEALGSGLSEALGSHHVLHVYLSSEENDATYALSGAPRHLAVALPIQRCHVANARRELARKVLRGGAGRCSARSSRDELDRHLRAKKP